MKNITKFRTIALSLTMLIGLIPLTSFAQQRNDDFFRANDDFNGNRLDGVTWYAITQNFGESPVGSGLIILTAVGIGYALLKKKED